LRIQRKRIDLVDEKNLIIGMITSTRFLRSIIEILKPTYLQSKYSKEISKWCINYFKEYDEAPKEHIQSIYNIKKEELEEDLSEVIAEFLIDLNQMYEDMSNYNVDYFLDRAVVYLKKRALLEHREKISSLIDLNKVDEAELEVANYRKVSLVTSKWTNPFEPQEIESTLLREEEYLLLLPGILGDFLGSLKRKWLVSLMGPMKRGKTWWLEEFKFAALTNRLKVVEISLEMDKTETNLRTYKRLTSSNENRQGNFIIPIFDCQRNQKGDCDKKEKTQTEKLADNLGRIPKFTPNIRYRVCTYCKGHPDRNYLPAIWYVMERRPLLSYSLTSRSSKGFQNMYGEGNLRTISYPIGTVNISDILRDLEILEFSQEFVPDVIILDYMDLLKSEDSRLVGRDAINETWKKAKGIAQERNCLWVTATQSNRQSFESKNVKKTQTGEDIRKLAHVDIMATLNQTETEKRKKIMRMGILAHRHKYFDDFTQIVTLQQLELGQPYLDGFYYVGMNREEEE